MAQFHQSYLFDIKDGNSIYWTFGSVEVILRFSNQAARIAANRRSDPA
jgi:hypothetical protein